MMALPGRAASEFRRNAAKVVVRYLGGDRTLVDEIAANRAAQEELAQSAPDHPARLFGEAVERDGHALEAPRQDQCSLAMHRRAVTVDVGLDLTKIQWSQPSGRDHSRRSNWR